MLECRLCVVMGTGRRQNATNQRLSPLQLHFRRRIALHLHDLYVMRTPQLRSSRKEFSSFESYVDVAHCAICDRVAEVVADSGHQKVFRESPDMLSGAKKRQGHQRRTFAGSHVVALLTKHSSKYYNYSRACIEENFGHSLVAICTSIKIQRCVSLIYK